MITWEEWKDTKVPDIHKSYSEEEIVKYPYGDEDGWDYCKEYLDDFAFEAQESEDLFEFQEWIALEQFFGQRLSYQQYEGLAAYYNEDEEVDGNILDLGGNCPWFAAFRKGDHVFFTSSDIDSDIDDLPVEIVRLLDADEVDLADVGPMFEVRAADGTTYHVFRDELTTTAKPKPLNDSEKAELKGKMEEFIKAAKVCQKWYTEIASALEPYTDDDDLLVDYVLRPIGFKNVREADEVIYLMMQGHPELEKVF